MPREYSQAKLSIDRYPDPACSYAVEDGQPTVLATNGPFETEFGNGIGGESVTTAFEELGLDVPDSVAPVRPRLERGEEFHVHTAQSQDRTTAYRVRTVPPAEREPGFLLFVGQGGDADAGAPAVGIDDVASVVSHDLRNPLDVARARLEAGRELDEDEHFEHVAQAHERMERIIQDVLTVARGEEVVEPDDTVDLTDVAESAWETVETNGSRLTVADPLPTTTADPDRVGRLFENLFRNAVEHASTSNRTAAADASEHDSTRAPPEAPSGRPAGRGVTVTVGRLEGGGGFYVADDGPGIPASDRERVFEPGYSTDDHGTGLGLAIVERIADIHGWSVAVTESEDGARFAVGGVDPAN
jgi:signal transduction histidine kinase